MIETIGMVAAVALPFFNIPLIIRIHKRQSSKDLSMTWALGVFSCLLLMLPAGLRSTDVVFRVFAVVNVGFFTAVVLQVLRYR